MRLASKEDFYGEIYTDYRHHEGYAKRAKLFHNFPEPILVVGCGFGFLVEALINSGKSAWGIDASPYAIENRVNNRIHLANILDLSSMQMGQFETVLTEDLFPHLSDEEVLIAARNCQALAPFVIHMVTERGQHPELNYHTTGYWMNLTGQPTISLEGM